MEEIMRRLIWWLKHATYWHVFDDECPICAAALRRAETWERL